MKIAVIILANLADASGKSRVFRGLMLARELKDAGDEVQIVFDGSGTQTLATISEAGSGFERIVAGVHDHIAGACKLCAKSYGVLEKLEAQGYPLLGDYKNHASLRRFLAEGYQMVTF